MADKSGFKIKSTLSGPFMTLPIIYSNMNGMGTNWGSRKFFEKPLLTINAPVIMKVRDFIFLCGQNILWALSRGFLRSSRLFDL